MNISDMITDKVLYKEFASESSKGIPFTFRSKTNVSLNQEAKEIFTFIPKISGNLLLICHFTSNVGAPSHNGNFSIYVDDVFMGDLTVTSNGGNEQQKILAISFGAFSTIKVMGSTTSTYENSAFVSFQGAIIDKPDKYMMEVI